MKKIKCKSCGSTIMEVKSNNGIIKKKCKSCGNWNLFVFIENEFYKFIIKN